MHNAVPKINYLTNDQKQNVNDVAMGKSHGGLLYNDG